jgi:predicted DNA-binding ArsR family transcriptional regulator
MHKFLKFILEMKLYMYRTVPLPIIRSRSQAVSKLLWHIPLLYVQWKTPDDGQRNCPKHVEFHFKNKFEKLVHLWHIPLLYVQWKTPDDGQRNCPKHAEFNFKNKFEKLVRLVGFIIRNTSKIFNIIENTRMFYAGTHNIRSAGRDLSPDVPNKKQEYLVDSSLLHVRCKLQVFMIKSS